jgi:hypothetical protein
LRVTTSWAGLWDRFVCIKAVIVTMSGRDAGGGGHGRCPRSAR